MWKVVGGHKGVHVSIMDVCATCDIAGSRRLWRNLSELIKSKPETRWCVMGDFNATRVDLKNKGVKVFTRRDEIINFNEFI